MPITDVQLHPADCRHVVAYATVTIDGVWAVHDVKVVRGLRGLIVSCPSRRATDHCPACGKKNPLAARYCQWCGRRQADRRGVPDPQTGRVREHFDTAHPLSHAAREELNAAVLEAVRRSGYEV